MMAETPSNVQHTAIGIVVLCPTGATEIEAFRVAASGIGTNG